METTDTGPLSDRTPTLSQQQPIDPQSLWRILDVTRQLGSDLDLDTVLNSVIEAARHVLHAERGTVFLYDAGSEELYAKVATGVEEIRFPADRGIAGQCAVCRDVLNIPDCYADPRFNPEIDRKTGYRTRCLLAVPLIGLDDRLVGVMQLLNKEGGTFDEHDERIATALGAQCAVALQRARLLEEHVVKEKLERDLAIARDIQQRILPREMPSLRGYDIAGWSRPADETGGDIYDTLQLDEHRALLLLCDATGHGIGPALSVTQVRAMFRIAARQGHDLDAMFAHINDQLADDLPANRFVTAFLGLLDRREHTIHYHAGGQGPLLHYRAATGQTEVLGASTVPLGIMAGNRSERPAPIKLEAGDMLVVCSDGIFEHQNSGEEQFGTERTAERIHASAGGDGAELIRDLDEAVLRFGGDQIQADDMTVLLVKRNGE